MIATILINHYYYQHELTGTKIEKERIMTATANLPICYCVFKRGPFPYYYNSNNENKKWTKNPKIFIAYNLTASMSRPNNFQSVSTNHMEALPNVMQLSDSVADFKCQHKTSLFNCAFLLWYKQWLCVIIL